MKKYKEHIVKRYPNDYRIYNKEGRLVNKGFVSLEDAKAFIDKEERCMDDIRSEVYDALSNIMHDTEASKEAMEYAIEWFMIHFFEEV